MIQELGSDLIPVFAIACTTGFLLVWVICATLESIYKISRTSKLKEQLVERGFSAHEIAQIVGSGTAAAESEYKNPPRPPVKSANGVQATVSRV